LNHICYHELYPDTSHIHAKTPRPIIPFLQVEGRASASWPSADLPTQDSEWKHSVQTTDYGTLCILSCSFLSRVPRVRSGLQIGLMVYSPAHQSKDRLRVKNRRRSLETTVETLSTVALPDLATTFLSSLSISKNKWQKWTNYPHYFLATRQW